MVPPVASSSIRAGAAVAVCARTDPAKTPATMARTRPAANNERRSNLSKKTANIVTLLIPAHVAMFRSGIGERMRSPLCLWLGHSWLSSPDLLRCHHLYLRLPRHRRHRKRPRLRQHFRLQDLVELLGREQLLRQHQIVDARTRDQRFLRDLGGVGVADIG